MCIIWKSFLICLVKILENLKLSGKDLIGFDFVKNSNLVSMEEIEIELFRFN